MKKFLLAAALIAVSVSVHARALPVVPLAQAVKAPDAAEIRTGGASPKTSAKTGFSSAKAIRVLKSRPAPTGITPCHSKPGCPTPLMAC